MRKSPNTSSTGRVTICEIADRLKVHQSTVSRALRKDPRISTKMREKILQVAKDLDYKPDPMLSSLVAYRKTRIRQTYHATLGWITNYPTRSGWREYERVAYHRGAIRRATELGYQIEEFWLGESGMTQQRMTQILTTRNIEGLFFVPQPRSRAHLSLDWSKFSAISFGRTLAQPVFHNVDADHFRSFVVLMRQIKRLGYRRPGFATWPRVHEATDRLWTAAYLAYQPIPQQPPIPVFMHEKWTKAEFRKWLDKHKPDVVISHDESLLHWMEEFGMEIPGKIGFALAAKHAEFSPRCSGIDENSEFVAETAVNLLIDLTNRRETGIPQRTISTLIEGQWVDGSTLRRVNQ